MQIAYRMVIQADQEPYSGHQQSRISGLKDRIWRWIEMLVLTSFAFAQPLFSLVGSDATFLVAHDLIGGEVVVFSVAAVVIPAMVAIALDEIAFQLAGARYVMWRASLRGILVGLIVAPPLNEMLAWDGAVSVLTLLASFVLGFLLFKHVPVVSSIVRAAAVAPAIFLIWFLTLSPASALINTEEPTALDRVAADETSLVWLVFDQFPLSMLVHANGNLNSDRFPNFARLAESSTWYPNATTVASATGIAVPSALSGTYVESDRLPIVSATPVNLFTILGASHDVRAFETFTQLCPDSVCRPTLESSSSHSALKDTLVVMVRLTFADEVADRLVPEINDRWRGFGEMVDGAEDTIVAEEAATMSELLASRPRGDEFDRMEEFLSGLESTSGPAVHYLHLEKPHEPLLLLPDGRRYDDCSCYRVNADGEWPADSPMVAQRLQRYLMQAMFVDAFLGRVLDVMERSGLNDESVLVIMSDHGASLLPGTHNRRLDQENVNDILPVPMFVRVPAQTQGVIDNRSTQVVDLLPTVLDLLGVSQGEFSFDGRSLRDPRLDDRAAQVISPSGLGPAPGEPEAGQSDLVAWMSELFPDPSNPFRWGAHADLYGLDPLAAGVAGSSDLVVSISTADRLGAVDLSSEYVPAHVIGELQGTEEPVDLAVSINGRIAGLGTTFHQDHWRVSIMIDPDFLFDGSNKIDIYEITSEGLRAIPIR